MADLEKKATEVYIEAQRAETEALAARKCHVDASGREIVGSFFPPPPPPQAHDAESQLRETCQGFEHTPELKRKADILQAAHVEVKVLADRLRQEEAARVQATNVEFARQRPEAVQPEGTKNSIDTTGRAGDPMDDRNPDLDRAVSGVMSGADGGDAAARLHDEERANTISTIKANLAKMDPRTQSS